MDVKTIPFEPDESLCGVLGDVHGDLPALVAAVDYVRAEAARRGLAPWVAMLGDLVDRGPDSAGCAAFAMRLARGEDPARRDTRLLFVRGDHDEALSWNPATGLFSTIVDPGDWAERLNALPPDDPERAVARDYIGFVRGSPAAILLRGAREGVLLAHGGVPHADLLPGLDSLEAVGAPRCDRDFAWCRVASTRRKIPNRATLLCDVGLDDVSDFLARLAELVVPTPDNDDAGVRRPFSIPHFVHGHEHTAPGFATQRLRDGATMWTVSTFHAEEEGFLPAIRPSVVLLRHAEDAEVESHAESAKGAEVESHAESAEFCLMATFVPTVPEGAEPPDLRTIEPSNPGEEALP